MFNQQKNVKMNAKEFFYLVAQLRTAQKDVLHGGGQPALRSAIMLEKKVDEEIARVKQNLNEE